MTDYLKAILRPYAGLLRMLLTVLIISAIFMGLTGLEALANHIEGAL